MWAFCGEKGGQGLFVDHPGGPFFGIVPDVGGSLRKDRILVTQQRCDSNPELPDPKGHTLAPFFMGAYEMG